ncbi:hypothetical protein [Aliamphritea hakodatensis]|uniref:hypothetical protein n=1 Tax=Aliamphritea hakodatensis TaxID=2895352 RepID=UPI0022FD6E51|nr:hypothetical protein [Aliamphritea hakodatensis]
MKALEIRDALAEKLKSIQVANGYNTDLGLGYSASWSAGMFDDGAVLPVMAFRPSNSEVLGRSGVRRRVRRVYPLFLVVKGTEDVEREALKVENDLRQLFADGRQALGDLALGLSVSRFEPEFQEHNGAIITDRFYAVLKITVEYVEG